MTGAVVWSDETRAPPTSTATGELVRVDVDQVRAGKPASPAPVPGVPAGERPILVERL